MVKPQGFRHITRYFDRAQQEALLAAIRGIVAKAPFYVPSMPRSGKLLSVQMTNCGPLGWVTDKDGGYRYQELHPVNRQPWPAMPSELMALWWDVGGYGAEPEACLVNYYGKSSRLGSHRDADEADKLAPVISVSLGDDAMFHLGGLRRGDPKERMVLKSGDVVVLGGAARMAYHGIDRIMAGTSDLLEEGGRINLTLRRVTMPA